MLLQLCIDTIFAGKPERRVRRTTARRVAEIDCTHESPERSDRPSLIIHVTGIIPFPVSLARAMASTASLLGACFLRRRGGSARFSLFVGLEPGVADCRGPGMGGK